VGILDRVKQTMALFPDEEPKAIISCPQRKATAEPQPQPPQPEAVKVKKPQPERAEEKPKKKTWIEIMLVDMEGKPVPGVRYRVTLPDGGEPQEGTLNESGQAGYYEIEPGTCKVTFPDFDAEAWE
jgi:hypothetical protein